MKEGLIIVGVIVALVFTFMGYHQTKLVSDRVSSLEQNMGLLIKSAQEKQAMIAAQQISADPALVKSFIDLSLEPMNSPGTSRKSKRMQRPLRLKKRYRL